MPFPRLTWERAAFAGAFGSAAATMVSIAASQILLGLALLCLAAGRIRPALPPVVGSLGLFAAGTLIALAFSSDPRAGAPQIRKMYVFLIVVALAGTLRRLEQARALVWTWTVLGTASALWGLGQFYLKYERAVEEGRDFYLAYVADRITGFMSHWMTFSGLEMTALLFAAALLLAGGEKNWRRVVLSVAILLMGVSIVLGLTRGIWIATAVAGCYLILRWRAAALAAVPVVLLGVMLAGPESVRERIRSLVQPRGQVDSNLHRVVTWRTGFEMVKAHPWLGVGPERVSTEFMAFVPADIPRPLPVGWYGHLHNIYLQYAAERGIPTMLALLWMMGKALWDWLAAARGLAAGHPARWLLHGATAALIGMMTTGLFEHNLGDSEVLLLFFAVIHVGYLARERARSAPAAR